MERSTLMECLRIYTQADRRAVACQAWRAQSHADRLRGLLGQTAFPQGEGLLIDPCKAVHTWFMAFPIDVVFLDRHSRIVHLQSDLRPFRVSPVVQSAHAVLELPAGTIAACQLHIGDGLDVETHVEPGAMPQ